MTARHIEHLGFARRLPVAQGHLGGCEARPGPLGVAGGQSAMSPQESQWGSASSWSGVQPPPGPNCVCPQPQPCVQSLSLEKQPCPRSPAVRRVPGPQGLQLSTSSPLSHPTGWASGVQCVCVARRADVLLVLPTPSSRDVAHRERGFSVLVAREGAASGTRAAASALHLASRDGCDSTAEFLRAPLT